MPSRAAFRFGVAGAVGEAAGRQADERRAQTQAAATESARAGETPRRPGSARVVASRREKRAPPSPPGGGRGAPAR